jgi:thiol-disulfide isomerase/thioredoxin
VFVTCLEKPTLARLVGQLIRTSAAWLTLSLIAPQTVSVCSAQGFPTFGDFKATQGPKERRPTELLEEFWPAHPEGLAMVVEILGGGQAAPGRGWYRKGVSQTRFHWKWVTERFDRNRDGVITRDECKCPDFDFRRLDRDLSGTLTETDFEFPANELAISRSKIVFSFADANGDGKIIRTEYTRMIFMAVRDPITRTRYFADSVDQLIACFEESEKEGLPFLGLSDLQDTIDRRAIRRALPQPPSPDSDFEVSSKEVLLRSLLSRELGSMRSGPSLNDAAPDFTLSSIDGSRELTLSKLNGAKPVVLIFGSYSCLPFRNEAGSLEKLYRRYRNRVQFLMVYVRESNPTDGWRLPGNDRAKVAIRQPRAERERAEVARTLLSKLELDIPMVVDTLDDRVGCLYSGMPSRLYLVDRQGRIAYKGGRGPFGFKPAELEQSLLVLLLTESLPKTPTSESASAP